MKSSKRALMVAVGIGVLGAGTLAARAETDAPRATTSVSSSVDGVQISAPAASGSASGVVPSTTPPPVDPTAPTPLSGTAASSTTTTTTTTEATTPAPVAPLAPSGDATRTTTIERSTTTTVDPVPAPGPAAPASNADIGVSAGAAPAATAPAADAAPPAATTNNIIIQTPAPAPAPATATAVPTVTQPTVMSDDTYVQQTGYRPRVGAGLLIGGGAFGFAREQARGGVETGGYWNVRAVMGTRQLLGLEAAYVGSAQPMNVLGLSGDATLVGNGAEGALRLNIPIAQGRSLIEPFGFLGFGWSRYSVVNTTTNSASVTDNDDVLTVPFGAGLAMGYGGFFADARFTYRPTFYNDLLRAPSGSGAARLDNWAAGAQLGFEF